MTFNFDPNFYYQKNYFDPDNFETIVVDEGRDDKELTEFVNSLLADDEIPTVSNDTQLKNVTVISNTETTHPIEESSQMLEASINEVDSSKDQSTQQNMRARSKGRPRNFMKGLNYGIAREMAVQNNKNISIPEKAIEPKQDAVHLEPKKKRKGSEMAEPSRKMPRKDYKDHSPLETYFNEGKQRPISDLITHMKQISKNNSLKTDNLKPTAENVNAKKKRGKPRQTALFTALAEKQKESDLKKAN